MSNTPDPHARARSVKACLEGFFAQPDPTTGINGTEQTIDVPQPSNIGPDDSSHSVSDFVERSAMAVPLGRTAS